MKQAFKRSLVIDNFTREAINKIGGSDESFIPSKDGFLRRLVLNQKIVGMIFNKSMVIGCKMMNRCKAFVSFKNIKNIV